MLDLRLFGSLDLSAPDGRDMRAALAQPKRLALFIYLCAALPRGAQRRDRLVALFWPELDQEHARTALRKGVHAIRSTLGDAVLATSGRDDLTVVAGTVRCDVVEFEAALDAGRLAEALDRYRGDFLDGFFISGAPEFERWVDHERARLRGRAAAAAWTLADTQGALDLARRALALSPHDEVAVRRFIAFLDRQGDRAGALHAYESLARELADEYAARPSAETEALIAAVRQRVGRASSAPEAAAPSRTRSAPRVGRFVLAALVIVTVGAAWRWWSGRALPVTTSSRAAYAAYQDGARHYQLGDFVAARASFDRALATDSTFVMAAYYAAQSASFHNDDSASQSYFRIALAYAAGASERERLLIQASWAERQGEPGALALAESLAQRHPDEAAGQALLGRALVAAGDFLGAVPHLVRAAADSTRPGALATLADLRYAYWMADSLSAAERVAREWVRREPGSPAAWHELAGALEFEQRYDEALGANRTASGLRSGDQEDAFFPAAIAIKTGRFHDADALIRRLMRDERREVRERAHWGYVISLRNQGRWAEALDEARRYRRAAGGPATPSAAIPEAQVLFELGRWRAAAALFDSIAKLTPSGSAAVRARTRAWHWTHEADALAAGGDTAQLAALADSVEAAGRESAYGRDRLLHHHVRGLLWMARRHYAEAAQAFERASFSLTGGFSRNNLVLAEAYLATGRPKDAVRVVEAALAGPLDASGLYTTQTELHAALARATAAQSGRVAVSPARAP